MSRRRVSWMIALASVLGIVALGSSIEGPETKRTTRDPDEQMHADRRPPRRDPVHGANFPDGVLALTWDDGPAGVTLDLARYLRQAKVSATFFVVGEWSDELSADPGIGRTIQATGYQHLPVLGELVALGHRLGGHTHHHVLLEGAPTMTVVEELTSNFRTLAPFITNELRMFRAPGGAWNREAAEALADPALSDVIGPIHWNVDAKDWDASLHCRSSPAPDCEPGPLPGTLRVRPEVIAKRYLAQIEQTRRGIVLLHDRVGDVDSRYSLDVARRLVPELDARGFVFAAPVLAFSPLRKRMRRSDETARFIDVGEARATRRFADINGDGRADLCEPSAEGVVCALSFGRGFKAATVWSDTRASEIHLADINGDGRADLCVVEGEDVACGLAP